MVALSNNAEGGTSGTTVTTANSGGASGNAFDSVNSNTGSGGTLQFDNTQVAHGGLSYKFATGATATGVNLNWLTASFGTPAQAWFRFYIYMTAAPAATLQIFDTLSSSTAAALLVVQTTGKVQFRVGSTGTQVLSAANAVPLNQWVRFEGFVIGSATVGQVSWSMFSGDNVTAIESQTSTATLNTTGTVDTYRFGVSTNTANVAAFWLDDLGLSTSGLMGPVAVPGVLSTATAAAPAGAPGIFGATATAAAAAPAGGLIIVSTVSGALATATAAAPAGSLPAVNSFISGVTASDVAIAPVGTVTSTHIVEAGVTATATASALPGTVLLFMPGTTRPGAIYGQVDYGQVVYGQKAINTPPTLETIGPLVTGATPARLQAGYQSLWVAEPFIAQSLTYSSVGVSWTQPLGVASAYRWRLLSNRYGYPVDQNDGKILIDQPAWPGTFYLDLSVIPGTYVYYGLYAQTDPVNNIWVRVGVTGCLTTENAGQWEWLLSALPYYFTANPNGELSPQGPYNQILQTFLQVLGWGLDYVQGQYDHQFQHLNDPMAIPIDDLVNLAGELGMPYDPMISVYLMRKAAANWAHVAEERGTALGVANQIDLLTGFGVDLQVGPNLMLDNDQSYFPDPAYPAWNSATSYIAGEIVTYSDYVYQCILSGSPGVYPTGTSTSNTVWQLVRDASDPAGILTNPNSGGVGTWEVVYPALTVSKAVRGQASSTLINTDGGTVPWPGNPLAGQKVLLAIWSAGGETVTSVIDNGVTPTTFTQDLSFISPFNGQPVWIYRGDNITLPASGAYHVTISTGAQGHHVMAAGVAYSGLAPGGPVHTGTLNNNTNNNPPQTASVSVPLPGGVAIGVMVNDQGSNSAITLRDSSSTPAGAYISLAAGPDGTTYAPGAIADGIVSAGTAAIEWGLQVFADWSSGIAVYAELQPSLSEGIGELSTGLSSWQANTLKLTNATTSAQDMYVRSVGRSLSDVASLPAVVHTTGPSAGTGGINPVYQLSAPTIAGNALIVGLNTSPNDNGPVIAVATSSDNVNWANAAFTVAVSGSGQGYGDPNGNVLLLPSVPAGTFWVRLTLAATSAFNQASFIEASGLAGTIDRTIIVNHLSGGSVPSGWSSGATATTSVPNELVVGLVVGWNNTVTTTTVTGPGAPWVNISQETVNTDNYDAFGYQIATSTGSFTYSGTNTGITGSNNNYAAMVVTFPGVSTGSALTPGQLQAIGDGVPVPYTNPQQNAWVSTHRYHTNDIVVYQNQPFIALRASTGATPVPGRTPSPEWAPLSTDARLRLMIAGSSIQNPTIFTSESVAVTPFVEWYDQWGNYISRITARTPVAGTPGIPDQLAFDAFMLSPATTISGRSFDNAYAHNWIAQDNDFVISQYAGGCAYPKTGARSVALTTGTANGQVGVTLTSLPAVAGNKGMGITFRWSGETNYWAATVFSTGVLDLYKVVAGVSTVVTGYGGVNPGDRIVVQFNGSAITVLLNGVSVATASDSFNSTATSVGMIVE